MFLQDCNIEELVPAAQRSGAGANNGAAVDVRKYAGPVKAVLQSSVGSGTNPTLDVKVQSRTNGGAWSDVSGASFTQVTDASDLTEMIEFDVDAVGDEIRAVHTLGGTSPAYSYGVALVAVRHEGRNASQSI